MSTSVDQMMSEARARVFWGEPGVSIREFLISSGVSAEVAQARVSEFESERNRELRKIGLRNLLVGGTLAGAAGLALYLSLAIASATSGIIKALGLVLLAGVYGLWKLLKGAAYLFRPQSEHKWIPDITQSDLIE